MDADSEDRPRERISRREKRWSMNSQRLEQIVAELMRPIGDLRRSFDTDLSALLEEYLTEAGLHALEAEAEASAEAEAGAGPVAAAEAGAGAGPNFAELALLLQQSASIYGRKVDFLYQHVLAVSEALQHTANEASNHEEGAEAAGTPAAARRKRRSSARGAGGGAGAGGSGGGGGFARIELEASAGARREAEAPRPPPTLPRMYLELEPRVLAAGDAPLLDYAGEPIGLLQDYHVTWRLQGGLLVEELECAAPAGGAGGGGGGGGGGSLRGIPLAALQAAIEAAAPPPPSPPATPPPADYRPPASTPIHAEESPEEEEAEVSAVSAGAEAEAGTEVEAGAGAEASAVAGARRKRRLETSGAESAPSPAKLHVTPELRAYLSRAREFSVCAEWVSRLVRARRHALLLARAVAPPACREFRGFDCCDKSDDADMGGFPGWPASEARSAQAEETLARLSDAALAAADSDDDGFFEQSSLGDSDHAAPPHRHTQVATPAAEAAEAVEVTEAAEVVEAAPEWAAWRAGVVQRAAAAEARRVEVRALGGAVLAALPADGGAARFRSVLRAAAQDPADVSRLFLATLFLANAGNVEIEQPAPLSVRDFSLRLLSADPARYCAAAAADPVFLAR